MRAGRRRAEQAGGRLDPPMVVMLDEAANICRIADLPDLYSHLGSRGMMPVTILQSYEQGETVWGEQGHGRLVGRGDQEAHRRRRRLTPARPRCRRSCRPPRRAGPVRQRRRRPRQRADLLPAAADPRSRRHPRPSNAEPRCCWPAGNRPALLDLRPWYASPGANQIDAARLRAEAAIQRAAQGDVPADGLPASGDGASPAGRAS